MERSRCLGVILLLLGGFICECEGCWEHEKIALMQLKPFFPHIDGDWGNEIENCCEWEWVECNSTSGRVTKLFLNRSATITQRDNTYLFYKNDYIYSDLTITRDFPLRYNIENIVYKKKWYLNASLFLPFGGLNSLYLSGNVLAGCIHNHVFERLSSKLNKLEILDLSSNYFNESILLSLNELSSLKSLYLGDNLLEESNAIKGFKWISKLKNLELLDLDNNMLGNNILSHLNGFTSLKNLYLQNCGLKGTIQMQEFSNMTNLTELYLGWNEIESLSFNQEKGEVGLLKLELLGLTGNHLDNSILESLGSLTSLKRLYIEINNLEGSINIKVLNAMSNLKELYMWGYQVSDFVPFQVDGTKLEWVNLEVLDLSGNFFDNSILPFLSKLTNLNYLSLRGQELKGTIDLRELRDLKKLKEFDISCDSSYFQNKSSACSLSLQSLDLFPSLKTLWLDGFNGTTTFKKLLHNFTNLEELWLISSSLPTNFLQAIGQFTSLKRLNLESCEINNGSLTAQGLLHLKNMESLRIGYTCLGNSILDSIGAMPSLNFISLTQCGLDGTLPVPGICDLRHLRRLDISYNNLKGNLPDCLSNLTSLEYLDLSSNQLSGNISSLRSLTSLQNLKLSDNYFHIPISLGPLFNLSKLKSFEANNNTIYTETEMPPLAPSFQLNKIGLSCCGEVGSFPRFLYYQHDLSFVDFSNINITREFPYWLLENNTRLQKLLLTNNTLMGNFELPFLSNMDLSNLDISQNSFHGKIPVEIGEKLPNLRSLNMSKNSFTGDIPASIGDMKILVELDLANNILTGGIPEPLAMGCSELMILVLSNNNLQGQMFSQNISLMRLEELRLDGNHFSGRIPYCLSKCSSLITLDLSNNQLSERIPGWMGDMSSLERIIMPNNLLEGKIPVEFCQLGNLVLLDLSANSISGNLPSYFSPSLIKEVYLSKNRLRGALTNALRNSPLLMALDISHNQLSGRIPSWIGGLSNLNYLLLNNNSFEGSIPIDLCNLSHLSLINLSHNNLSGHIPPCLKLTTLMDVFEDCANSFIIDCVSSLSMYYEINNGSSISFPRNESIEFTTKNTSYAYKGRILAYMSGIDLSCNNLVGEIPYEIGNFHKILVLNLSHNNLTGPIPPTFSNLTQIESLDLSYNNLSGNIPPQLVGLYRLEYFNVSCNNLSGKTPQRTAQFATFDESSYLGNPFLCGEPLPKCADNGPSSSMPTKNGEDNGPIDMNAFCVTFGVAYMMVLLSIGVVLSINPYWRRVWFYRVQTITTSCYYFVIDNILPRKFHCGM